MQGNAGEITAHSTALGLNPHQSDELLIMLPIFEAL